MLRSLLGAGIRLESNGRGILVYVLSRGAMSIGPNWPTDMNNIRNVVTASVIAFAALVARDAVGECTLHHMIFTAVYLLGGSGRHRRGCLELVGVVGTVCQVRYLWAVWLCGGASGGDDTRPNG